MATKTVKTVKTDEYDFDAWSDSDEEKAIEAVATSIKVPHIIVENSFVGRFPSGEIVTVPLRVPVEIADVADQETNPVDQLRSILDKLGDKKATETILSQGLLETVAFANSYFLTIQKIAGASLPQSSGPLA